MNAALRSTACRSGVAARHRRSYKVAAVGNAQEMAVTAAGGLGERKAVGRR